MHLQGRMLEMHSLIVRELELNGIRFDRHSWLSSKSVIQEAISIIIPAVHEGKIFSTGVIFVESLSDLENLDLISFSQEQIGLARMMADGSEWFLLYDKSHFYGLVHFKIPLYNELLLIRSFPLSGGMIIKREANGMTKFVQGDGIIIHDNRRWFTKPNIKEAAWKVSQCVAQIDKNILGRILEFAFHVMSPVMNAGGVIVWFFKSGAINSSGLSSLNLSILEESHARLLCNLLSQVDGAAFLDSDGRLIDVGVQLKYSEKSRELVPEFRGTRHTSAIRYSYDNEETIVISISEDGPVTVFSNGANVADLQIYSAYKKARILSNKHPAKSNKMSSLSFEVICKACGKKTMIEQVNIEGLDEKKEINCPTCRTLIYSAVCSSLEGRPYKDLYAKMSHEPDESGKNVFQ